MFSFQVLTITYRKKCILTIGLLLSFVKSLLYLGFPQGLEDHLGDMDFKIAGTRKGITAIQLDIKPAGIPLDIICESLEHAYKGRLQILDHMEQEINAPRTQDERNSPRLGWIFHFNCVFGFMLYQYTLLW